MEGENSGYSSEPKMYLKFKVSPVGMKSNSKTTPFVTVPAAKIFKCGSDATLAVAGRLLERFVELLGPWAAMEFPVVNNKPELIGKAGFVFVKLATFPCAAFAVTGFPLIVIFDAVTPIPNKTLFTSCVGVCVFETTTL